MRAVAINAFGGPERLTLTDLPRPTAARGEVLVRTLAAGVNPVDWKIREGSLSKVPHGFVPTQDKQYLVAFAQLPDAATLDRTERVMRQMADIGRKQPGVENAVQFPGLSINGFVNSPNAGIVFFTLKPFDERHGKEEYGLNIAGALNDATAWTPPVDIGYADYPRLASGPSGLFLEADRMRSLVLTQDKLDNQREAERVFPALVDYAGERGVKLIIENCVMEGWHPDGYPGNIAYSPELWEWMFSLGLFLNFDPSHLLWLGIDPVEALRPYVDRVANAHAKDAETFQRERNRYGFFGRVSTREQDPWDMGWWRYRIPGLGQVDFPRYVDALYEGGFDGALAVEHEDPVWGGTPELVEAGLRIAHNNLRGLVIR